MVGDDYEYPARSRQALPPLAEKCPVNRVSAFSKEDESSDQSTEAVDRLILRCPFVLG